MAVTESDNIFLKATTTPFDCALFCELILLLFYSPSLVQARCIKAGVLTVAKQTKSIMAPRLALCAKIYCSAVEFDK